MKEKPHVSGMTVDATLWDSEKNAEVHMRGGDDGVDALFVDFYKEAKDDPGMHYQKLQEGVIAVFQENGFRLGKKREYFHFDYRPDTKKTTRLLSSFYFRKLLTP